MDRGLLGQVCQQAIAGDLVLTASGCKLQYVRIGLGDTAGDDHTARIAHIEHIALGKLAIDLANTHREQGRATADQRLRGTVVNRYRAMCLVTQRDPQLARRNVQALRRRIEQGSHALAAGQAHERIGLPARANHALNARRHQNAARTNLGDHAARAHRSRRIARRSDDLGVDLMHDRDELGRGVLVRIGGVEAVDVRERHAQIGRNQAAHEGRERVVVAKFDLIDGNGIVLVDDRYHAQLHQAQQGVTRVQVGRATGRIVAREQHERGKQVTRMELLVVDRRDDALAGRSACLQARQIADRLAVEAQYGIATGNGAGAHHDQAPAELAQGRGLIGQATDKRAVDLAVGAHHRGRADLYHHRFIRSRHTSNQSTVQRTSERASEKMIRFPPSPSGHFAQGKAEAAAMFLRTSSSRTRARPCSMPTT